MVRLTTKQTLELSESELWNACDHSVRSRFGNFIKEFNKREWSVRIGKTHSSFEDYTVRDYTHREEFGTGFVISGKPIPYFHPNRSFHDEVIWLNSRLYYDKSVSFENKLVNSAIVKFYGPSRTLDIITGHAEDLPYLTKTSTPYIDFSRVVQDEEYEYTLMKNIELASAKKQQIWGTTELRTSLQVASRNYCRSLPRGSLVDQRGVTHNGQTVIEPGSSHANRKMRTSDMIAWIKHLAPSWVEFYSTRPTMQESYEYLTAIRGIGPYYGYHFSSNLARMPGVGHGSLIDREFSSDFRALGIEHGNLDENADYVVAGPGATSTLKLLFPSLTINGVTSTAIILRIRDAQQRFLDISSDLDYKYLTESTELGKFTTFGVEIACCQFNVFTRLRDNPVAAAARANAPISKEVGGSNSSLESFFE